MATTRNFIMDCAMAWGFNEIMMVDDDLTELSALFYAETAKGEPTAKRFRKADFAADPLLYDKILAAIGNEFSRVCEQYPSVMIGNLGETYMNFSRTNSDTRFVINGRRHSCGLILYRIGDMRIDTEFNVSGEDIGYDAQVLHAGRAIVTFPTFVRHTDVGGESSSYATMDQQKRYAAEQEILYKYAIKDYHKIIKRFPDGQYHYGTIDWRKFHKIYKTEPIIEMWG
jgi:hypothetical protein